jgi:hypothetical protein
VRKFRYLVAGLMVAATIAAATYRLFGIRASLREKAEEGDEDLL